MRAHFVVVVDVLVEHTQQMLLVQHDDVVQTFPPQCSDDSLGDGIGVRRVHRCHDRRDPDVRCALDEVLAVTAVMIANEVARRCSPRRGLDNLLPDPLSCRVLGDVHVEDSSASVGDEDDRIERPERERLYGEEVDGPDFGSVVTQEGAPGL